MTTYEAWMESGMGDVDEPITWRLGADEDEQLAEQDEEVELDENDEALLY